MGARNNNRQIIDDLDMLGVYAKDKIANIGDFCALCNVTYGLVSVVVPETHKQLNGEIMLCTVCYKDHISLVHNNTNYCYCTLCNKHYEVSKELKNWRLKNNMDGNHVCRSCISSIYPKHTYLDLVTNKLKDFFCDSCGGLSHVLDITLFDHDISKSEKFCEDCIIHNKYLEVIKLIDPTTEMFMYWIAIKQFKSGYTYYLFKCETTNKLDKSTVIKSSDIYESACECSIEATKCANNFFQ